MSHNEQECIPVRCVPTAAVTATRCQSREGLPTEGDLPSGGSAYRERGSAYRGGSAHREGLPTEVVLPTEGSICLLCPSPAPPPWTE